MKMLLPVLLMLATGKTILPGEVKVKTLPPESREVLDYLPRNIVIAHRGTTYWAPEETEAAMRWARNIGADYLELDLQRTKDGVLIALHDVNLRRTTNVETVFPDRADSPVSEFTLEELRQLDAGSWFNKANPDRARKAFEGLDILTLEDVVRIAEGYRIVRDRAGKRVYDIDGQGRKHTRYEKDPDDNERTSFVSGYGKRFGDRITKTGLVSSGCRTNETNSGNRGQSSYCKFVGPGDFADFLGREPGKTERSFPTTDSYLLFIVVRE